MKYIGSERDLMRQGQQNRRGRGRNNNNQSQNHNQSSHNTLNNNNNNHNNRKPQHQLSKNYESSGPDVKIRGTAQHIAEKYTHLARDAASAGDFIVAENYLQHAEHYNRIIMSAQAANPPQQPMNSQQQQPYAQPAPEQPAMNGHASRYNQPEERYSQPQPQNQVEMADDALPGFLTQPVQVPEQPALKTVERLETVEPVVRARRRRRPANGPEGRNVEKVNGHGAHDAAETSTNGNGASHED